MVEGAKMAIKAALLVGVLGAFATVLLVIQIPSVDFSPLSIYIGHVYAFAVHWCPIISQLWTVSIIILGANLALLIFRAGLFLFRTIMTIVE